VFVGLHGMFYSIGHLFGAILLAQADSSAVDYSSSGASFSPVTLIFSLAAYIFGSLCFQKIFQRLNIPNDWMAWVPIANYWLMFKAGDQSPWWTIAMLIPLVNIVGFIMLIIALVNIVKKLGKSPWLLWLMIIPIANFWLLYHLGFQ
jgi:Family of unknown function (DUF5684)